MDAKVEELEKRLSSFFPQLKTEHAILDRFVYKNKNQHHRCSYFQHLLKVRRDLRLLQCAHLEDLVSSCFHVITDKKPKQKLSLLESLKKRKCDSGKPNFLERLLGAARLLEQRQAYFLERLLGATRLLEQMVEPMLKVATNISTLLAQSFFMGFSLAILALLARLRVLVQQILLDVVTLFNIVSALSKKKHSMKINQDQVEVFREYFPTNKEVVTLECSWETDKFVLLEKTEKSHIQKKNDDRNGEITLGSSHVIYQSINAFLEDDEIGSEDADADETIQDIPAQTEECIDEAIAGSAYTEQHIRACINIEGNPGNAECPNKSLSLQRGIVGLSNSSNSSSINSAPVRKVAFLSVKRPAPSSTADLTSAKRIEKISDDEESALFSVLSDDNLKKSLF